VEFVSSKDEFKSSFLIIVLATYEVANRPFASASRLRSQFVCFLLNYLIQRKQQAGEEFSPRDQTLPLLEPETCNDKPNCLPLKDSGATGFVIKT